MPDRAYREELVRLYATNKVDAVGNLPEFKELREKYKDNPFFDKDRSRIEIAKAGVERRLENPRVPVTQQQAVRNAVRLLIANRTSEESEADLLPLLHELIVIGYRKHWTDAQQSYFDAAWQTIQLKYDFFLSFTSRYTDPEPQKIIPINIAYKHLINYILDEKSITEKDRRETNLLAKAIHSRFSPRRGFYYPRQQFDNADTEKKLEDACDNSFLFVQLIQNIIFDPPPEGKNYCFHEWEKMMKRFMPLETEKRILYVLAEKDHKGVRDQDVPLQYADWHEHVVRKDRPYLPEPGVWDESFLEEQKTTITKYLVHRIDVAWKELAEGAPA